MRLDVNQRRMIRDEVASLMGPAAEVRLFGSRVRDGALGGDVDLLVELPVPVADPAWSASRLEARLMRRLEGRRVDVILAAPNIAEQPIHRVARAEGCML
jgi:predicted nucleotidyltransferase